MKPLKTTKLSLKQIIKFAKQQISEWTKVLKESERKLNEQANS